MYPNIDSWGTIIVVFGIVCAVVGWCAIEFILWLCSFIHITVGG